MHPGLNSLASTQRTRPYRPVPLAQRVTRATVPRPRRYQLHQSIAREPAGNGQRHDGLAVCQVCVFPIYLSPLCSAVPADSQSNATQASHASQTASWPSSKSLDPNTASRSGSHETSGSSVCPARTRAPMQTTASSSASPHTGAISSQRTTERSAGESGRSPECPSCTSPSGATPSRGCRIRALPSSAIHLPDSRTSRFSQSLESYSTPCCRIMYLARLHRPLGHANIAIRRTC